MDDERVFKQQVLNGTLYDHLMGLTGYTDRRKFKADFFEAVLYGDPSAHYSYTTPNANTGLHNISYRPSQGRYGVRVQRHGRAIQTYWPDLPAAQMARDTYAVVLDHLSAQDIHG